MNVRLIAVDRLRSSSISAACAEMRKRLLPYYGFEELEVRAGDGGNPARAMNDEAERILRRVRDDERMWLLDRSGTQLSSRALARRLDDLARTGARTLTLVVAGAYGAAAALRERAEFVWSLSDLTLLHEWARAIVLEQLYRAAKISRNEPYHH
jgi:23S rRNA (pseudouridine1915-N3)-methyltransferase